MTAVASVTVTVNGELLVFDDGATLADVVTEVSDSPKGIAVAVDAQVVPRSLWAAHELADGERIEILTAAQGG